MVHEKGLDQCAFVLWQNSRHITVVDSLAYILGSVEQDERRANSESGVDIVSIFADDHSVQRHLDILCLQDTKLRLGSDQCSP